MIGVRIKQENVLGFISKMYSIGWMSELYDETDNYWVLCDGLTFTSKPNSDGINLVAIEVFFEQVFDITQKRGQV